MIKSVLRFFLIILLVSLVSNVSYAEDVSFQTLETQLGDPKEGTKVIDQLDGVYKYRFQNANVDGKEYTSEDILEIVRVAASAVYFKIHTEAFNGHECNLNGIAKYTRAGQFLYVDPIWDPTEDLGDFDTEEKCELALIPRKNDILLVESVSATCRAYCGARAGLAGTTFNRDRRRPIRYMKILKNSSEYKRAMKYFKSTVDPS